MMYPEISSMVVAICIHVAHMSMFDFPTNPHERQMNNIRRNNYYYMPIQKSSCYATNILENITIRND